MALTYGFYDSVNGDRKYSADDFNTFIGSLVNDGVFENVGTHFTVVPESGLTIKVGSGKAWFNNTWTSSDSDISLTISTPNTIYPRIDSVVIEVNKTESIRENFIKIVDGVAAASPTAPTLEDSDYIHQIALANVYVSANSSVISKSNITNLVGLSACPFTTGILETTDISELYSSWNTDFNNWASEQKEEFLEWFNGLKDILTEEAATALQSEFDDMEAVLKSHTYS